MPDKKLFKNGDVNKYIGFSCYSSPDVFLQE